MNPTERASERAIAAHSAVGWVWRTEDAMPSLPVLLTPIPDDACAAGAGTGFAPLPIKLSMRPTADTHCPDLIDIKRPVAPQARRLPKRSDASCVATPHSAAWN
jgi:hypothetical protein